MVQAPQAPENQEQEHFGGLSTGGLALPTAYYVRDVDFSTVEVQRYLEELGAEIVALDGVNQETPVGCNHWVPALRNVEHQTRWSRDCLEFLRVFWCFLQVAKHYSDIFRHIIQKSSVHHVQNMFFPSSPHEEKTLQHARIGVSRVGTASSPSGPTTTVGPRHLSPQVPSYRWRPTERDAQQHCLRESPAVSAWEMHSDVFFLCV